MTHSRIVSCCGRCGVAITEEDVWIVAAGVLFHCSACGQWSAATDGEATVVYLRDRRAWREPASIPS
jgi:hypothetical protein